MGLGPAGIQSVLGAAPTPPHPTHNAPAQASSPLPPLLQGLTQPQHLSQEISQHLY